MKHLVSICKPAEKKARKHKARSIGASQQEILRKLAAKDGWWSAERNMRLGVGYRVIKILNSLVRRGLLSEKGGVYKLTVAGRQEIQNVRR